MVIEAIIMIYCFSIKLTTKAKLTNAKAPVETISNFLLPITLEYTKM